MILSRLARRANNCTKSMYKVVSCQDLREKLGAWRAKGETIGFVPTMGYLHQGHLSLLELAKAHSTKQVASVFVNPTQFNSNEDFEKYPRNLQADFELLEKAGADLVFAPSTEEVYAAQQQICIAPGALAQKHEGEFRPGHFAGVLTVVSILFNLFQPDIAVFGEKDFQQLRLIEQLVDQLKFPVRIVRGPTVREADGLAMSSRNARLSSKARQEAAVISQGLFLARKLYQQGERGAEKLINAAQQVWVQCSALKPEYLRLVDQKNLEPLKIVDRPSRLLAAAYIEGVRLIDNLAL